MTGFEKQRKKFAIAALVKSALCGVSAGILAAGATLLGVKLGEASLAWWWYLLIAVAGMLIGFAAAYFLTRPSDLFIARRLDGDYALGERVETALEYAGAGGAVVEMQREDTNARLEHLPARKKDGAWWKTEVSRLWQYALILLLSLAVGIASLAIPWKEAAAMPDRDMMPFALTDYQRAAVRETIENVRGSDMGETVKADAVAELEKLLPALEQAKTVGEMERTVYAAIGGVSAAVEPVCTYRDLSTAFGEVSLTEMVRALRWGATVYKIPDLLRFDQVKVFAADGYDMVLSKVSRQTENMATTLSERPEAAQTQLVLIITRMGGALAESGVEETDALKAALVGFCGELQKLAEGQESSEAFGEEELAEVFARGAEEVSDPLFRQAYDLAVDRHVNVRLRNVFELPPLEDDPYDGFDDDYSGADDDVLQDDNGSQGGGYGDGDIIYGSDDLIYDPYTGEYVPYGDLLMERYYPIVQEYLQSGNLTAEQEAAVRAYMDLLFGGFGDEDQGE